MAVAGWYADPYGAQGQLRYWDGAQWTANVMPRPSSAPMQGAAGTAGASGPLDAQAQAAQAAQMQARAMHESVPLGASTTAAPAAGAYGYPTQAQAAEQQYAAQAQANPYASAAQTQQGYNQMANAYEAAAQGYAQAANAYDAAAQGYAQAGQYDAATAQAYGQYDPNAQAYGQMGASPYYQGGYDPYGQMGQAQQIQAPEGANRTLRLIAVVFYFIAALGVLAVGVVVALTLVDFISMSSNTSPGGMNDLRQSPIALAVVLPLAWMIPMLIHTLGILKGKKRNSVLFALLTLLLCGIIPTAAGIVVLMYGGFPTFLAILLVLPICGFLAGLFLLFAKKDPKPAA